MLLFVAWNMGEWREFARLRSYTLHYRLVMLGTFVLTVVLDLTVALEVGMVLACVLFVRRMGGLFSVEQADTDERSPADTNTDNATTATVTASFTLRGALFFGAVVKMDAIGQYLLQHLSVRAVQLDCSHLLALDTSGIDALQQLIHALAPRGGQLVLQGLQAQPLSLVQRSGLADKVILESKDI